MSFATRAVIAILAGIGAGVIGFWLVWEFVARVLGNYPGLDHDYALLAGIFVPFLAVSASVFRAVSGVAPAAPRPLGDL